MSIPTVAGYPNYKDYGFIPTLYTAEVNIKYYAECMLPRITSSKFTGEVKGLGDSVVITQRPTILVSDYTLGEKALAQVPVSDPITLSINRAVKYRFLVNTITKKQSKIDIAKESVADAIKQIDIAINTRCFADVYAYAHASNHGNTAGAISGAYVLGDATTPLAVTKNSALDFIVQFAAVMNEQNATLAGRWVIIPQWLHLLLITSDLKSALMMGDPKSVLRTGYVGRILDLDIYASNLLHTATVAGKACTYMLAGNQDAIAYCMQLVEARSMHTPDDFALQYDGVSVFDWKVVKPEGLCVGLVYKG